ncbi:MAG: YIP1 family protein [Chloroflexi bacterium]|nr:YIP1 family protein [Chloroflexota bacterium]
MASTRTQPPITEVDEKPKSPRRQVQTTEPRELQLTEHMTRRSLVSQVGMALMQPANFYRSLPASQYSRQWVWVGLLILGLVGFSAVRYDTLKSDDTTAATDTSTPIDEGISVDGGKGGGGGIDFGGIPSDAGGAPTTTTDTKATPEEVTAKWSTALEAAGEVVLQWIVIAILLIEVSLLRGRKPRMGHNWQIAIYSSLPLALMAALQLAYYYAGGKIGQEGMSGLIDQWKGYADLSEFQKNVAYSLSTRLTLFWLWSLSLLYLGARYGLKGRAWSATLVVLIWAGVLVVGPVVAGWVEAPKDETQAMPSDVPIDPSLQPGSDPLFDGGGNETVPETPSEQPSRAPMKG